MIIPFLMPGHKGSTSGLEMRYGPQNMSHITVTIHS